MESFAEVRRKAGLTVHQAAETTGYDVRTIYRWETGEAVPRKAAIECLKALIRTSSASPTSFRFIDLFAGIGGIRRGFESIGGSCIFTSEWDRFSKETYLANFACDHEVAGDITTVGASDIPDHDVLLAGFPCQPFSIAGVSKLNALKRNHGFMNETQGTLFFDVARIIAHHRPRAFLLENVKNLISHDKGKTFKVIYKTLTEELGYNVHCRVIDGKSFVPQHRERIYIVGFRDQNEFSFDTLDLPDTSSDPKLATILHPEDGTEFDDPKFTKGPSGTVHSKYTLSDHLWTYLQDYAERHRQKGNGFGFGLCGPQDVARTLSARYYKDGSEILIRQAGKPPRRLTPRECARLMGFEKPGATDFRIPVSDTQAYRQFGNSVVVPVVEAVAAHMRPWIMDTAREPKEAGQAVA